MEFQMYKYSIYSVATIEDTSNHAMYALLGETNWDERKICFKG